MQKENFYFTINRNVLICIVKQNAAGVDVYNVELLEMVESYIESKGGNESNLFYDSKTFQRSYNFLGDSGKLTIFVFDREDDSREYGIHSFFVPDKNKDCYMKDSIILTSKNSMGDISFYREKFGEKTHSNGNIDSFYAEMGGVYDFDGHLDVVEALGEKKTYSDPKFSQRSKENFMKSRYFSEEKKIVELILDMNEDSFSAPIIELNEANKTVDYSVTLKETGQTATFSQPVFESRKDRLERVFKQFENGFLDPEKHLGR